jgi:hypothetical protein
MNNIKRATRLLEMKTKSAAEISIGAAILERSAATKARQWESHIFDGVFYILS